MSTYNSHTGQLSPQSLLQQRYIIVGQAGKGGMGAVYQATDIRLAHRRVAIKEMSQGHLNDEELEAANTRFQQEASMLCTLSHPNLPRIYDAFSENGRSYLVMDFIEGKTLYQLLREARGQPLQVAQVLTYARQLCEVLFYLHQQNPPIIFRDVKPTNIMVTENGQIFLIDFGIARFFKEGQQQDTALLGSPGYAAPEQHGIAQSNPRSDIYSLGATLHYCLTGRDPYRAQPQFSFPPVRQYNPQVPVELDQLIQRMVAHDERARPASALEVQQSLMALYQKASEHTSNLTPAMAPTSYNMPLTPQPVTPPPARPMTSAPVEQHPTVAVSPARQMTVPRLPMGPPPVTPASPWSPGFLGLFFASLLVTLGGSIFAIVSSLPDQSGNAAYGWSLIAEAGLSLLLFLITMVASISVKSAIPRTILAVTGLGALIGGIAFLWLGSQDVQQALAGIIPIGQIHILDGVVNAGLIVAAIASLCWFLRPSLKINLLLPLVLLGGALVCVLIQPFFPLAGTGAAVVAGLLIRHGLLLIGLILLIQGVLLAIQTERVYSNTGQVAFRQV
ncbi:MAG TPA: protein kinase [Ktedonosporobacter sp.]|nr:protein kinase [Ktedonosporobacter sp.]